MFNRFACLLSSALWLAAAPALAQPAPQQPQTAPSTTVAPVTVEAAPKPKVIQQESRAFVQGYAAAPNAEIDQIGRWHDAVCVQVVGLVPEVAATVKARVEDVAKAVGLKLQKPGCAGDIEIVFTDKPQALMDAVAKKNEVVLGYFHRHEGGRLKTVTRPIQAWYMTATRGGGGPPVGALFGGVGNIEVHDEVIDDPENPPPTSCGDNPHFTHCLKSVFRNVLVVADANRLQGRDIGLLTDYIVMLALSQPKSLDGCGALPSVIDLLSPSGCPGREAPDGLTPADAAYLTALYTADLEANKAGEQGDITNRMAKILTKAAASGAR